MPRIDRPDPPYLQVTAQIRADITAGRLRVGDRVPSAREIVRQWEVSLATATKVLAKLREQGLARGVPGIGTVVVAPPVPTAKDHALSMRRTGRIYAPGGYARIVAAEVVPAPGHVAHALGIEPDAAAVRRRRVTYRGEEVISISTSWFAAALAGVAPRLLVTERIVEGTAKYLEEVTGRLVISGRDHIYARIATDADVAELGVAPGTAILHGENWYLDEDDAVIEFGEYVSAGDRGRSYQYRVE